MIYADNAATSPLSPTAFEKMKPLMLEEFGNASQLYSFSRNPRVLLQEAREIIAGCIHAVPEEIFFTSGGSESDNWAVKGLLEKDDYRQMVTSSFEHHAILHSCETIERLGFPVSYVSPDHSGHVTVDALARALTKKTKLVSIMMSNNELGTIQPIKELCEIAHAHGALFHTDAVQSMGHIPIDVRELGVDMMSASSHKFNGPKGIGFLYIRKGTRIRPYMDGGAQERGLGAGGEGGGIGGKWSSYDCQSSAPDFFRADHLAHVGCIGNRLPEKWYSAASPREYESFLQRYGRGDAAPPLGSERD